MSLRTFLNAKFIPLALALILTLMTVFGIGGALFTEFASQSMQQALFLSDHYQQARFWIASEESLERKYRLEPSSAIFTQHRAAAAHLQQNLEWIAQHGNRTDSAFIRHILDLHQQYLTNTALMFAAVDAANMPLVIQLDGTLIDPVFSRIETMVDAQAGAYHQLAIQRSQALTNVHVWLVFLTPFVYVSGIALLV